MEIIKGIYVGTTSGQSVVEVIKTVDDWVYFIRRGKPGQTTCTKRDFLKWFKPVKKN